MASILKQLSGDDLRLIGQANEVVARVLREAPLFRELFQVRPGIVSPECARRTRSRK